MLDKRLYMTNVVHFQFRKQCPPVRPSLMLLLSSSDSWITEASVSKHRLILFTFNTTFHISSYRRSFVTMASFRLDLLWQPCCLSLHTPSVVLSFPDSSSLPAHTASSFIQVPLCLSLLHVSGSVFRCEWDLHLAHYSRSYLSLTVRLFW